MASDSKSVIAKLNKDEKLNGDNYEIWHRKIQRILKKQDALETLTNTMVELEHGTSAQVKRDMDA